MNYREHKKRLLENEQVKKEYENLLPEYKLAKSIIEQRIKRNTRLDKVINTILRKEDMQTLKEIGT